MLGGKSPSRGSQRTPSSTQTSSIPVLPSLTRNSGIVIPSVRVIEDQSPRSLTTTDTHSIVSSPGRRTRLKAKPAELHQDGYNGLILQFPKSHNSHTRNNMKLDVQSVAESVSTHDLDKNLLSHSMSLGDIILARRFTDVIRRSMSSLVLENDPTPSLTQQSPFPRQNSADSRRLYTRQYLPIQENSLWKSKGENMTLEELEVLELRRLQEENEPQFELSTEEAIRKSSRTNRRRTYSQGGERSRRRTSSMGEAPSPRSSRKLTLDVPNNANFHAMGNEDDFYSSEEEEEEQNTDLSLRKFLRPSQLASLHVDLGENDESEEDSEEESDDGDVFYTGATSEGARVPLSRDSNAGVHSREWRMSHIKSGKRLSAADTRKTLREMRGSILELITSKRKTNLTDLAHYLGEHTNRRMFARYNYLKTCFDKSVFFKPTTVIPEDVRNVFGAARTPIATSRKSNGPRSPLATTSSNLPALPLSSIMYHMCSTRVQVNARDLRNILRAHGIAEDIIDQAHKIAALMVVVAACKEADEKKRELKRLRLRLGDKDREQELQRGNPKRVEAKLIEKSPILVHYETIVRELQAEEQKLKYSAMFSHMEFVGWFMPSDPAGREAQFDFVINNRKKEASEAMAEKARVDEYEEQSRRRILRVIGEFDQVMRQRQPFKGVITDGMLLAFKVLVRFCHDVVEDNRASDHIARIPQDVIFFLGKTSFPEQIQQELDEFEDRQSKRRREEQEAHAQCTLSLAAGTGLPSTSFFQPLLLLDGERAEDWQLPNRHYRISASDDSIGCIVHNEPGPNEPAIVRWVSLLGPCPMLSTLTEMVAIGKPLPGYSYVQAVQVLQFIAASKIQAIARGVCRYRPYQAAREKWTRIFRALYRRVYDAWKKFSDYSTSLKKYCLRKIVVWKYYTKRAHSRRALFATCFWPFYTWRKYARRKTVAKEKAFFLTSRVIPTVGLIHVFRAWKNYTANEVATQVAVEQLCMRKVRQYAVKLVHWWHWYARQKRQLRKRWFRKGKALGRIARIRYVKYYFVIWRMFSFMRIYGRDRVSLEHHAYRRALLGDKPCLTRLSFSEKRRIYANKYYESQRKTTVSLSAVQAARVPVRMSIVGTVARKVSVDATVTTVEETELQRDVRLLKAHLDQRAQSSFDWKRNWNFWYDVDSDGDDDEDLSEMIVTCYKAAALKKEFMSINMVTRIGTRLASHELNLASQLIPKVNSVHRGCLYREYWNLFDAALRFHRYARLAFRNLRYWSIQRRKVRQYIQKRQKELLRIVVGGWKEFTKMAKSEMKSLAKRLEGLKESEALNYLMVSHTTKKKNRMRKIATDLEAYTLYRTQLDREYEASRIAAETARQAELAKERARSGHRRFNMTEDELLEDIDREERISEARRQASISRRQILDLNAFNVPDLLEAEARDREVELDIARKMSEFGDSCSRSIRSQQEQGDKLIAIFEEKHKRVSDAVENIMSEETDVTREAIERQTKYATKFYEFAADNLVSVLARIKEEVTISLIHAQLRLYFRALRLPLLIARSKRMLARKRLLNWMRICRRLAAINEHAPHYRRIRMQWHCFNNWLRHTERAKMDGTRELVPILKRQLQKFNGLTHALQKRGFTEDSLREGSRRTLTSTLHQLDIVFHRWALYASESQLQTKMYNIVVEMHRLRTLKFCFWAIRSGGAPIVSFYKQAATDPSVRTCPALHQIWCDLDQLIKRFLPRRKRGLLSIFQKQTKKTVYQTRHTATASLSFKSFIKNQQSETKQRINSEQRHLFEAFEKRGSLIYNDVAYPSSSVHSLTPPAMARLDGKIFVDPSGAVPRFLDPPVVNDTSIVDSSAISVPAPTIPDKPCAVAGGFRLHKLRFAIQNLSHGTTSAPVPTIVGWRFVWTADGMRDMESTPRGTWHGAGITHQEFIVPKGDFVITVEYLYDSSAIVGIRLRYAFEGWSRWIGGKTSLSTLSVILDANASPRDTPAPDLDEEEKKNLALPYNYIIGFTGLIHNKRVTRVGVVVRQVIEQHVLSYFWVNDAIRIASTNKSAATAISIEEAASGLIPPEGTDLMSIPSEVNILDAMNSEDSVLSEEMSSSPMKLGHRRKENTGMIEEGDEEEEEDENNEGELKEDRENQEKDSDNDENSLMEMYSDDESDLGSQADEITDLFAENNKETPTPSKKKSAALRRKMDRLNRRSRAWVVGETDDELLPSEMQFFDVLRMRMIELSEIQRRSENLSRRLWTSREFASDPEMRPLVKINIVKGLANWLFNALSKKLGPACNTEREGLRKVRQAVQIEQRAKNLRFRAKNAVTLAARLLRTPQHWSGMMVLGPAEREAKKAYLDRIQSLKATALQYDREATEAVVESKALLVAGRGQLSRISLCSCVLDNFHTKILAARRKESLLEKITLDELKSGLFAADSKEEIISADQMAAIHASLKSRTSTANNKIPTTFIDTLTFEDESTVRSLSRSNTDQSLLVTSGPDQFSSTASSQFASSGLLVMSDSVPSTARFETHSSPITPKHASKPTTKKEVASKSGKRNKVGTGTARSSENKLLPKSMEGKPSNKSTFRPPRPSSKNTTKPNSPRKVETTPIPSPTAMSEPADPYRRLIARSLDRTVDGSTTGQFSVHSLVEGILAEESRRVPTNPSYTRPLLKSTVSGKSRSTTVVLPPVNPHTSITE